MARAISHSCVTLLWHLLDDILPMRLFCEIRNSSFILIPWPQWGIQWWNWSLHLLTFSCNWVGSNTPFNFRQINDMKLALRYHTFKQTIHVLVDYIFKHMLQKYLFNGNNIPDLRALKHNIRKFKAWLFHQIFMGADTLSLY